MICPYCGIRDVGHWLGGWTVIYTCNECGHRWEEKKEKI